MTYEDNYLVHYGVKGQRWGIRKYQNEDGSLTQLGKEHYSTGSGGNTKFDKEYRKEVKKYNKLRDKADIDLQRQKAEKHEKNADKAFKVAGTLGAAGLGTLAVGGKVLGDLQRRRSTEYELSDLYGLASRAANNTDDSSIARASKRFIDRDIKDLNNRIHNGTTVTQVASLGLMGSSLIAAGIAGQQKARALIERRRTTPAVNMKINAKKQKQYEKITNMVKDTPYAALFADQIAAYKKEHPNTELSDKQIMKNLM